MAEARQASDWDHTAEILAMFSEKTAKEINPYRREAVKKKRVTDLKCLFDGQ